MVILMISKYLVFLGTFLLDVFSEDKLLHLKPNSLLQQKLVWI